MHELYKLHVRVSASLDVCDCVSMSMSVCVCERRVCIECQLDV